MVTTTCFPDPRVRAVRWTQLARVLPSYGYRVVFLSRYYGYAATREEIDQKVHPSCEIEYIDHPVDRQPKPGIPRASGAGVSGGGTGAGTGAGSATGLLRSVKRGCRSFAVGAVSLYRPPDSSRVFWDCALDRIRASIDRIGPDAVVCGFPTGGNVSVSLELEGGVVVADFEDPFVIDPRFGPRGSLRLRAGALLRLEERVHARCAMTLHAIPLHERWARLRWEGSRAKCRLLMMGTPSDMVEGRVTPTPDPGGLPVVRVVGAMSGAEMLRLAETVRLLRDHGLHARLELVGDPPSTSKEIGNTLGDSVLIRGRVAHHEALSLIAGATVLVSWLSPERSRVLGVSSKLFEFAASGNPSIHINPTRSDRLLAHRLPNVDMLREPGVEELAERIRRAIERGPAVGVEQARSAMRAHTWSERAKELGGWFDRLLDSSTEPKGRPA